MANRINPDTMPRSDADKLLSFSPPSKHSQNFHPRIDDLIRSLANERENRRAQQIGEWERLQQQTLLR